MKYFYSHLIEVESLIIELDTLNLTQDEKIHLGKLVDANLHHTILDTVLSELSDDDKKIFMQHLSKNDHTKIWEHLNSRIDKIEERIKKAAEKLTGQFHEDIQEAKKI